MSANLSYPNDRHYRTAQAVVSCKLVKAGEFVSVEFLHETDGVSWFTIRRTERGELETPVWYPKHFLTRFCL